MTLPITYADGNTVHGTDVDTWTAVINALTSFVAPPGATLVAGFTTTVTSGSTITLTVTSTTMQVLTGSTAQLVTLPTTSVVAGAAWIISNQSSNTTTVQSSGANTVTTVPAGDTAMFTANTATPTTAAGWSYNTCPDFPEYATTATAAGTTTLNVTSPQVQVFTGSTTQTVTLPTTSVPAGAQWLIVNQSTGAVTVNGSSSGTAAILAGSTTAVLTASQATPTTGAQWVAQYGAVAVTQGKVATINNTLTFTGTDGTTMNFPGATGYVVAPPSTATSITSGQATSSTNQTAFGSYTIPANSTTVGQAYKVKVWGTQSATSATLTWQILVGTNGTTADTVVATASSLVKASASAYFEGLLTIRTITASGSCVAGGTAFGQATNTATASIAASAMAAAINAAVGVSTQTATVAVNCTVQNYVTVSAAASAGTYTAQNLFISVAEA